MTTQLPLNLVPKPPPYNDSSKPFPSFWRHVTRFLANSVTSSDQLIRIGTAFHLRNIAETKKLSDIDPARFHTPETNTIIYMQIVTRHTDVAHGTLSTAPPLFPIPAPGPA